MERFEDNVDDDGYINIQHWMVKDIGLRANELIIYALIHGFSQDGMGYFWGSIKYIMKMTNLSKETVLSVLQSLVKKNLIVKKDVKSIEFFDTKKTAQGNQHYCLYYTTISRINHQLPAKDDSKSSTASNSGSRNLTGKNNSPVKNLDPSGSRNLTRAGQEFRPNNKDDNKDKNSTSSENSKTKNQKEEVEEFFIQNDIQEKLNMLFGYPVSFSPSPIPKLLKGCKDLELKKEELLEYLGWSFDYLKQKCKEKENFDGYFYKSFTETHLMAKFKNITEQKRLEKKQKENLMIVCPVCGLKHLKTDFCCNSCGLEEEYLNDEQKIKIQRKKYFMPDNQKEIYEKELEEAEKEFPFLTRIMNKELQEKYCVKIMQIEKEFGLYEEVTV